MYWHGLELEFSSPDQAPATAHSREPTAVDEADYSDGYSTTPPPELVDEGPTDELSELAEFGIQIQRIQV